MNNTELIERLVELERSMVERRDVDVKAFKEKQRQELVDYELKKTWESNGYSQASVKRICVALINAEKKKSEPNYEPIIEKMDIFLGANRLTTDEYTELMELIN